MSIARGGEGCAGIVTCTLACLDLTCRPPRVARAASDKGVRGRAHKQAVCMQWLWCLRLALLLLVCVMRLCSLPHPQSPTAHSRVVLILASEQP